MIRLVILLACVPLGGCMGGGCSPDPPPSSEDCATPSADGALDRVDVGVFDGATFTAYRDGDVATLVYGGQGFPMLVVNHRLSGRDLPACIAQVTRVAREGIEISSEASPLVTRQVLPTTWITGDALLIVHGLSPGDRATIEAEVRGVATSVEVWIDYEGFAVDAAFVGDAPGP
jgi:hypothetical protein